MTRFNLWIKEPNGSKVLCHGDKSEMEELMLFASSIDLNVEVRPDNADSPHEDP